jgi:hypothetical protein
MSGFNGEAVTLGAWYDTTLLALGEATVVPGRTTFPSVADLSTGVAPILNASVDFRGDKITIKRPASEEGDHVAAGIFNGLIFTTPADSRAITGVKLKTNVPGLSHQDVDFGAHFISLNGEGLTLPTNAPAYTELTVRFARAHEQLAQGIASLSTSSGTLADSGPIQSAPGNGSLMATSHHHH